ncbi:type II secretion system F family protein [Planctomicrobium sp. SH664]|uniref:type II secretion system F family protein n=1 Tax=Planctomicrobium sp. SH664 TaxID=3448125 RepID=UPI003F5ADE35
MDTNQLIQMAIGTGIAIGVYLLYKWIQRRRRRAADSQSAPKMRPRTSPTQTSAVSRKVPQAESKAPSAAAEKQPVATILKEAAAPRPAPSPLEPAVPYTRFESSTSHFKSFWPAEPGASDVRPHELDETLPYADPDDYRFGTVTPVLASLSPTSENSRRELQKALLNAGHYSVQSWSNFAALRYLGIILPILFFGLLLVVVPERLEPLMMIGLIVGPILGWALPALYIRGQARQRLHEIEIAMPDMLDLLNMCVSQGMTVPTAIGRVGRELKPVYPALSKELSIVTDQARVGSFSQALSNFSRRVDVPDVHSFTSLLIQTEQMGTSVSEALADYSDSMRESLRQRADEKANSATFKLLFPTVICLMPAVFLFLMGPAVVELNRFFAEGGLNALRQGASTRPLNEN